MTPGVKLLGSIVWHRSTAKIKSIFEHDYPETSAPSSPYARELPQELIEMILAHVILDASTLKACSATCCSWSTWRLYPTSTTLSLSIDELRIQSVERLCRSRSWARCNYYHSSNASRSYSYTTTMAILGFDRPSLMSRVGLLLRAHKCPGAWNQWTRFPRIRPTAAPILRSLRPHASVSRPHKPERHRFPTFILPLIVPEP